MEPMEAIIARRGGSTQVTILMELEPVEEEEDDGDVAERRRVSDATRLVVALTLSTSADYHRLRDETDDMRMQGNLIASPNQRHELVASITSTKITEDRGMVQLPLGRNLWNPITGKGEMSKAEERRDNYKESLLLGVCRLGLTPEARLFLGPRMWAQVSLTASAQAQTRYVFKPKI